MYSSSAMILFYITGGTALEELEHLNQQISTSITDKPLDIANHMKQLTDDYIRTIELVFHINSCFGTFILLNTLHEFCTLLTAFAFLHVSISNLDLYILPIFIGFVLASLIFFYCVNFIGEQLVQKVCNIHKIQLGTQDSQNSSKSFFSYI